MDRRQAHALLIGSIVILVAAIGYYAYNTFSSADSNPPTTIDNKVSVTACCAADGKTILALTSNTVTTTLNQPPPSSADTQAPTIPSNLTGAVSNKNAQNIVDLTWTNSTDNVGVTGYKIERGGQTIATSATTTYSDVGTVNGTYAYNVRATDAAGNVSGVSNTATVSVSSAPAPTPTPTPSPTPSPAPSPTPTPSPSPAPTPAPSPTPSPSPTPTPSPTPPAPSDNTFKIVSISDKAGDIAAYVIFSTNVPSTADIAFGTSSNKLTQKVSDKDSKTSHNVRLTVKRGTTYFYKVTASANGKATSSTIRSFRTTTRATGSTGIERAPVKKPTLWQRIVSFVTGKK